MYKCKVCNKEFELEVIRHYAARDVKETGVYRVLQNKEEKQHDAFDRPCCGCQNITQERKRDCMSAEVEEHVTASDFEEEKERPKCFGDHESGITCLTCDKEKECIVTSESDEEARMHER